MIGYVLGTLCVFKPPYYACQLDLGEQPFVSKLILQKYFGGWTVLSHLELQYQKKRWHENYYIPDQCMSPSNLYLEGLNVNYARFL